MRTLNELSNDITRALGRCDIAYTDMSTSALQTALTVSISKEVCQKKMNDFVDYLNDLKVMYQSTLTPGSGFIKLTIFSNFIL
ncbi:hypothetical protein [Emticicia sp. C21]|uniref:hypothetical protein n=1 Tax=Emticicia sp. C21 TaxID=2302915 RepID=UPI000E3501F0|nr:hypothetical protein [Emticicia sp. C21]RFS17855.1 hypothetical protein D0T08_01000 [Emticicia sp. C21]